MPTQATARRTTTAGTASPRRTVRKTAPATEKAVSPELAAVPVRESFEKGYRRFICPEEVKSTFDKEYSSLPHDVKLERFAKGTLGVVSDCYILFAVAMLGFADRESIFSFLQAMRKVNKELSIPDISDVDTGLKRLANLVHSGFLFTHEYELKNVGETGYDSIVKIFSITSDGLRLVNQKLGKRIIENKWAQAKPFSEIVGWSCASYISTCIANQTGFHEFNQGLYRTRDIGTVIMPPIVKTELNEAKEHPAYISTLPAYLRFDPSYQTKNDYKDACYRFVNTISQYFYTNDMKSRYGRMVVVVEDDDDLMEAATWMHKVQNLKDYYSRIFFTAEGAVRSTGKLYGNFLSMVEDPADANNFLIVPGKPDFIRSA